MLSLYLELGFDHLLDLNGYDHILYLVTLCAIYSIKDWKKVLFLATAFTIGHSITLALNAYNIVSISSTWIETLIPITIILTAIYNLTLQSQATSKSSLGYVLAIGFGLIHGMGISNFLKTMMSPGESLITPLLGFNIGVELAQIVVVILSLIISYLLVDKLGVPQKKWMRFVSIASILICLYLLYNMHYSS